VGISAYFGMFKIHTRSYFNS